MKIHEINDIEVWCVIVEEVYKAFGSTTFENSSIFVLHGQYAYQMKAENILHSNLRGKSTIENDFCCDLGFSIWHLAFGI